MSARELFVVTTPGLEGVVAEEIAAALPDAPCRRLEGGLEVEADDRGLCRLSLRLRAATRILARVARLRAASFAELHRRAARLPWEDYLRPGAPVVIRATAKRSRLYHTGGIIERVVKGIGERLGEAPALLRETEAAENDAATRLVVRLYRDRCTISVDASGDALHRRGYRLATAKAPLRENLAAGLLLASGLREGDGRAIVDPMCGAGTIAIEGALLAAGAPPSRDRPLACAAWPCFAGDALAREREALPVARAPAAPIVASDRDPGAIAATRANAERAGALDWIRLETADFAETAPPAARGLVITNPPYGVRIADKRQLRAIYRRLGEHLRERFAGDGLDWQLALLAATPALAAATGLPLERRLGLRNGGIAVELFVGPIR
jgi:putative N6-adenine-specific DNA methylase